MGKRFEGEEPTFLDMLAAFQALGLTSELGEPGEATAYAPKHFHGEGDTLEFNVVPGSFTAQELAQLRAWAA